MTERKESEIEKKIQNSRNRERKGIKKKKIQNDRERERKKKD
jgi:hypothetical protein